MKWFSVCLAFFWAFLPVTDTRAQGTVNVDVELVLAVDASRSMSPNELEIQRRGYAEALSSPEVIDAITRGINGQVAIMYFEWSGRHSQQVVVDWTLLRNLADAQAFAAKLKAKLFKGQRLTSISMALEFAAKQFETNGYRGLRRIIDISGDGPNNDGPPVVQARDELTSRGIVINGLPLMTREGKGATWDIKDLDQYYLNCVVGGPGAFVVPVYDWAYFPQAVRRKLVLELAMPLLPSQPARFIPAQAQGYDCMVGERVWDTVIPGPN